MPETPQDEQTTGPPQQDEAGRIKSYRGPAGGWGSLKAGFGQILDQGGVLGAASALLRVNQPDGFDCPGCAWPEPKKAGMFEFCENGIKAVTWEATPKRVEPAFFKEHSVAKLRGESDHWLESHGRLTTPMRYNRETDHYEPVSWEAAFCLLGEKLRSLSDPNRAVFYTSGRTSNEAAFLYQLFIRKLGTNNLPDCSNMCHESSGVAMTQAIGTGKGTVTIQDFELADCILVIGQNPGTNHPRMLTELQKAAKRGAKIITINPLKERGLERFKHPQHTLEMLSPTSGTAITSTYLQPVVGGDLAALKGICKRVIEMDDDANADLLDRAFIDEHTSGFDAFIDDLRATAWKEIEYQSGLSQVALSGVAEIYANSKRVIACWAMGLTQHKHAVPTIQMILNLLMLRGNIGKDGAGACPVRGHSNVQGDRTMGITELPTPVFLDSLGKAFDFQPPHQHGYNTVESIESMSQGKVDVFFAMGGNFAAASPDTAHTYQALERCGLTVHVSTKLNRSHTVVGHDALILPCLGRTELDATDAGRQSVTVEDSMSQVHASSGSRKPASPMLLSEPAIVARLARATFPNDAVQWEAYAEDYSLIRDKIAEVLPAQFHDYNERVKTRGGFYLGNPARDRTWKTVNGKAIFTVSAIPDLTLPSGQLRLMTLRSHDQYNTTVYSHNDRYRGVTGTRRIIFMHRDDIAAMNLQDGQSVAIESHFADGIQRSVTGFRVVPYDIPRHCAAGYFPELNPLVSVNSTADGSHTPTSKFIPVTVSALS
jgi:molybdopterin-dependent oxidoreductase alpha subunit